MLRGAIPIATKKWILLTAVALTLTVVALASTACADKPASSGSEYTYEQYSQLEQDMTIAEAQEIVGSPGVEEDRQSQAVVIAWRNADGTGFWALFNPAAAALQRKDASLGTYPDSEWKLWDKGVEGLEP